jgi:hypothetical protein
VVVVMHVLGISTKMVVVTVVVRGQVAVAMVIMMQELQRSVLVLVVPVLVVVIAVEVVGEAGADTLVAPNEVAVVDMVAEVAVVVDVFLRNNPAINNICLRQLRQMV